jgi:hypothetical protein
MQSARHSLTSHDNFDTGQTQEADHEKLEARPSLFQDERAGPPAFPQSQSKNFQSFRQRVSKSHMSTIKQEPTTQTPFSIQMNKISIEQKQAPLKPILNAERDNPLRRSDFATKIKVSHRSSLPEQSLMEMMRPSSILDINTQHQMANPNSTFSAHEKQGLINKQNRNKMSKTVTENLNNLSPTRRDKKHEQSRKHKQQGMLMVNSYQRAQVIVEKSQEQSPIKSDCKDDLRVIQIDMIDSESPVRTSRQSNFQKLEVNILSEIKNDQDELLEEVDIETEVNLCTQQDQSAQRKEETSYSEIKSCASSVETPKTSGRGDGGPRQKKDLLTEIITRKDGGGKGGASHKAHMSYYQHMRRMKKRNLTMALDSQQGLMTSFRAKEEEVPIHNTDLDCVMVEAPVDAASEHASRRRPKASAKKLADGSTLNRQASKNRLKSERARFGSLKREFRSAFDVGLESKEGEVGARRQTLGEVSSHTLSKSSL